MDKADAQSRFVDTDRVHGPKSVALSRADLLFLIGLALLFLSIQILLLSPLLQAMIPNRPAVSLRLPSVIHADFTEYKSTFSCLPTPTQSSCAIHAKYKFMVPMNNTDAFGILAADYNGTLDFKVNGTTVDQYGPVVAVQRLMFGLPTLIAFPNHLLRPGTNYVEMTVATDLPLGALIHQVFIGNMVSLQDIYSGIYVQKWTIPKQVEGMLIAAWIISGYIALRHRLREYYSLFAFLTFICCSIFSSYFNDYLVGAFRISPLFFRLSGAAFIGSILTANPNSPSFISIKVLLFFPVVLLALFAQANGSYQMLFVVQASWAFCIVLSLIGFMLACRAAIMNLDYFESIPLSIAMIAIVINAFNILPTFGILNATMIGARGHVVITLVIIVTIKIFRTFTQNLVVAQTANKNLSQEVARIKQELDVVYFKDNALKQEITVQFERERLMGDLHDGLAGNLISINALAEHGKTAALDEIRRLSKLALLDLRLVVDSLDTFDGELAVALAAFKERITPQYSGTPTKISWETENAPIMNSLRPEVNLAIFRILQEAIANAVRHGRATRVHILVRAAKNPKATASIWILDNGTAAGLFAPGFGMRNMQRRAEKIFGTVYFRLHKNGSAVLLKI